MSRPHWVCPYSQHVPVYTAQAQGCSSGDLSKADLGLGALPRSKLLRFRFLGTPQRHGLGWACVFCPSQVRAAQVNRCLVSTHSPGGRCILSPPQSQQLSFLGGSRSTISGVPCVSSGELISGSDPPGGCQPSRIPGRLG